MGGFIIVWRQDFRTGVPCLIWLVLTAVTSLSGPFATYELLGIPERILFWGVLNAVAIFIGTAVRALVRAKAGLRGFRGEAVLTALISALLFPVMVHGVAQASTLSDARYIPDFLEISAFSFLYSLSVGAYRHSVVPRADEEGQREADALVEPPAAPVVRIRLMDRLLPEMQGDLLSISARDHFVDVRTSQGVSSLLLRLADAIGETEGIDGAQIHRSHWVAWQAVLGAEKSGVKLVLELSDGSRIPVSKTYRALLGERGIGGT